MKLGDVEDVDLLVIGSGEAGKYLAWTFAARGKKAVVVERKYVGGSCPNIACLPSKNIIHSAKVAWLAAHAESYGLPKVEGKLDFSVVRDRKREMVSNLVKMHEERFAQSGAVLISGEARFVAPKTVEVTAAGTQPRKLRGEHVVISTGSRALIDPIPGLLDSNPLTHIEALELDQLPEHLIVLGGGYVGLEFAQAMRRFGSRVTIVERSSRLLSREDADVAEALAGIFANEGIDVTLRTHVDRVAGRSGESVIISGTADDKPFALTGTHLLVATGRAPNTEDLQLENAGIEKTDRGFVRVDEHLQTTAPGVFAVGDCAGSPHFTHVAFDDFRVVRDVLDGKAKSTAGRLVPSCLFTDPELARVGLNEIEAKRQGISYRLLTLPMKAVLRTRTTGQTSGFLKALIGDDDKILGFVGLGEAAGETMATAQLAMTAGLPFTTLRDSIFTHPTYAEGLVYLFSGTPVQPQ